MKTPLSLIATLSFVALGASLAACSHQHPEDAREPELLVATTTTEAPAPEQKAYAPVDLRLTSSARSGKAEIALTLTPQVDVPSTRARIVLPAGVTLVSGALEVDLGAIDKGVAKRVAVRVMIPATGAYPIAGGVEVTMSPSRKVARSTVLDVGEAKKPDAPPTVIETPEGDSVHVQP